MSDVLLYFRRLDVAVDRCHPVYARLYSKDTLLSVEIVFSSFKTDPVEQKAGDADAGFPVYLIVLLNAVQVGVEQVEETG